MIAFLSVVNVVGVKESAGVNVGLAVVDFCTQLLLVALGPGTYTLSSTLFSDKALGEYGTLTVTS